jgi:hypothetical protein
MRQKLGTQHEDVQVDPDFLLIALLLKLEVLSFLLLKISFLCLTFIT